MEQLNLAFENPSTILLQKPTLACAERPQQRLENFGASALSDTELVATIIQGPGTAVERAVTTASALIAEADSVAGLASWQPADFQKIRGIGRANALRLSSVFEIARRTSSKRANGTQCASPQAIASLFWPLVAGLLVEKFWVLCLNRRNRLIKMVEISTGTATATLAHPREVFRAAIRYNATGIVCVHNHPSSGDPAPSSQDIQITRQLREASKAIDIELLDHLIVGRPESDPAGVGYYSFRSAGIL